MTTTINAQARNVLNEKPKVWTLDDCISEDEAELIKKLARKKMRKALVAGDKKGKESKGRTNSVAWLAHATTPQTKKIAERIAGFIGMPLAQAENFQVIRYEPGQEYRPHFDAYLHDSAAGKRTMLKGGQRMVTALCYLNEVEAGGETGFPKLDITVTPKTGRLLVFENCEPDSNVRTPLSLHAGLPVEAGIKWAFNLWFRERALNR